MESLPLHQIHGLLLGEKDSWVRYQLVMHCVMCDISDVCLHRSKCDF